MNTILLISTKCNEVECMERSHVFGKFIDKVNERDLSAGLEIGFALFTLILG